MDDDIKKELLSREIVTEHYNIAFHKTGAIEVLNNLSGEIEWFTEKEWELVANDYLGGSQASC